MTGEAPANSDAARAAEADAVYRKVGRRIIPFLILCYFSAYIDRSNVGIAKLQFTADLGLTEAMYGLGGGLFYLGYSLFEVPSNLLLARIGARRTFLRIMVLWSIFSASLAFITRSEYFYIMRFLLGAAEAGFFPGVLLYLSHWVPASRRARFTALFMSAMAMAGVVGGPLSAAILHLMDGHSGLAGWQWLFLIEGLPGVALGIIAYVYLSDRPTDAPWLTKREKQIITEDLEAGSDERTSEAHASFLDAARDPRFYALAAMSAALIGGIGGIALWLPTVIRATGITDVALISLLTTLPYFCALVTQQIVARRSDRMQERRRHASACAMIAAVAWLAVPFAMSVPWLAILLLTCATAATFGATGPFWAMPAGYLSKSAAPAGIALITTFGGVSAFVSPIIVGSLVTGTGTVNAATIYYGGLMLAGGLLLLAVRKPGRA